MFQQYSSTQQQRGLNFNYEQDLQTQKQNESLGQKLGQQSYLNPKEVEQSQYKTIATYGIVQECNDEDDHNNESQRFFQNHGLQQQSLQQNQNQLSKQQFKNLPNRWEQLYELDQKQRETKKLIKDQIEKEKESDPNLTFKPNLFKSKMWGRDQTNFMERNQQWESKKIDKIRSEQKKKQDKAMDGYTFKPELDTKNRNNTTTLNQVIEQNSEVLNNKSVENFLRRQQIARFQREQKEIQLVFKGDQESVMTSSKRLTVPKEFNLSKSNARTSPQKIQQKNRILDETLINEKASKEQTQKLREELAQPNKDSLISVSNITYTDAIGVLGLELRKLNLNSEEY